LSEDEDTIALSLDWSLNDPKQLLVSDSKGWPSIQTIRIYFNSKVQLFNEFNLFNLEETVDCPNGKKLGFIVRIFDHS
jgi:hypothetical protein